MNYWILILVFGRNEKAENFVEVRRNGAFAIRASAISRFGSVAGGLRSAVEHSACVQASTARIEDDRYAIDALLIIFNREEIERDLFHVAVV
ncbi:MAG: hypothetical protein KDA59_23320, partial [Planctomycetales bacterium]|nr:hypothetical protein [Planctomycetales bacterium]